MIHRKYFYQTWKPLFQFGDPAITNLFRPIFFIFPKGGRMKFVQARRLHIAITPKTVESLPVFPASFPNEMIRIHTRWPMTEMCNLKHCRPTIIIFFNRNWIWLLMKHLHWNLMSTKSCRAIFTFLTVIWMRQNATVFEYKKSFFTNSVKCISVFGIVRNSFRFNLKRPI